MKRLANSTIWAPKGVTAADWRFRGIFRVVLPVTDLLFLWFGVVGWAKGVVSVQDAAGTTWQTVWSAAIAVSALTAFIGVAFPRLWAVELCGKIALIGLVSSYVVLYLIRGFADPNITALAGLMVILTLLPVWRIADLGRVAWERSRG